MTFTVLVPDRFLTVSGKAPLQIEPNTRIASYNIVRQTTTSANGSKVSFDLKLQPGLDDTTFNVYGDGTTITGVVAIVGDQSGLRKEFEVSISK